jgi:hypothetical protein
LTVSALGRNIKAELILEEHRGFSFFRLRGKKLVAAGSVSAA